MTTFSACRAAPRRALLVAAASLLVLTVVLVASSPLRSSYDAFVIDGASATDPVEDAPDDTYTRSTGVARALDALAAQEYEVVDALSLSGDRVLVIVRR